MSIDLTQYATGPAFDPDRLARSWEAVRRAGEPQGVNRPGWPGPAERLLKPWEETLVMIEQKKLWASALLFDIDDPIVFGSMDRVRRRVLAFGY